MSAVLEFAARTAQRPTAERSIDQLTLVLVDDHPVLRDGVATLLRNEGHVVAGETGGTREAYELVAIRRPDVAVVDIALGHGSGIALGDRLVHDFPGIGVLLYTGLTDPATLLAAVRSSAHGIVRKSASPETLLEAISLVADGHSYVDPFIAALAAAPAPERQLSPRQREILTLLAAGATGPEIAERLVVSIETVKTHIRNAMERLGASTRAHAIMIAIGRGEILPPKS